MFDQWMINAAIEASQLIIPPINTRCGQDVITFGCEINDTVAQISLSNTSYVVDGFIVDDKQPRYEFLSSSHDFHYALATAISHIIYLRCNVVSHQHQNKKV